MLISDASSLGTKGRDSDMLNYTHQLSFDSFLGISYDLSISLRGRSRIASIEA
jgi:hypothetical protein